MKDKLYIGIDPGAHGGVAFIKNTGLLVDLVNVYKCPDNARDMATLMNIETDTYNCNDVILYIEHVWAFPTDARSSAFKFGYNYGLWKGIASAIELDVYDVTPKKWQEHFGTPKTDKKERKRWLKELAIKQFPNTKVTFNTSDALLIALYGAEVHPKP
jgi:hypothetical protein